MGLKLSILRAAIAAGLIGPAWAGDASTLRVLGFSEEGAVFAFEETGIQDGSGFPYANRFYINTATDTYLPGTPVRVRLDDETKSVTDARVLAREQGEAASSITDAMLAANPGALLAFNPLTEIGGNPLRIEFSDQPIDPAITPPRVLNLRERTEAPAENCYGFVDKQAAFGLSLSNKADPYGEPVVLHEDGAIPKSRNCPTGYRIGGVVRHEGTGVPILAIMINVRSIGFEGPDHRWIAVVKPDPEN
jgi:predicted secreted protein